MKRPRPSFVHQLLFALLAFSFLSLLLRPVFKSKPKTYPSLQPHAHPPLKVYVANIPASFNYGLLSHFYFLYSSHANHFSSFFHLLFTSFNLWVPPYPETSLIKPHAAEYCLLNDLQINKKNIYQRSTAVRVPSFDEADVVFVPFFASLSAQMELGWGQKGKFREKNVDQNGDYRRQRQVLDRIKASVPWRRSGGRDHVFVMSGGIDEVLKFKIKASPVLGIGGGIDEGSSMTRLSAGAKLASPIPRTGVDEVFFAPPVLGIGGDPVAMWHVRSEIAPAILLVGDLGEQIIGSLPRSYLLHDCSLAVAPASEDACNSTYIVQHIDEASFVKDVIIPCNHLLPRLHISHNHPRHTLLYFKPSHHTYTDGSISKKLLKLLENEPAVKIEEGISLNANGTGLEDKVKQGMWDSEFCLHPQNQCGLFDAIASLCIPVIVSDQIELPFEGMLDYTDFAVFVSVKDALIPNWVMEHLRGFSEEHKERFRANLAAAQSYFEYGSSGSAVNLIWEMIYQKLPMIRQVLAAERRKIDDSTEQKPVTCLCT